MDSTNFKLANRMQFLKPSEIRELLKLTQRPGMISFARDAETMNRSRSKGR